MGAGSQMESVEERELGGGGLIPCWVLAACPLHGGN